MTSSKVVRSLFKGFPTTYPQPLGANRKLIRPTDVYKDFGNLKLILARPEHSPILNTMVKEMYKNEVTNIAAGTTDIPDDAVEIITYNCVRYPISFFVVNSQEEVVSIACANILYRDNSKDPIPRKDLVCADVKHLFQANADLITISENASFERLKVDRLVHNELAFTPTIVRGKGISSTVYPVVLKHVIETTVPTGFRYNVGMVTSQANLVNMKKLGYRAAEKLPRELYKNIDGSPMELPPEETTAVLIEMDMLTKMVKGQP